MENIRLNKYLSESGVCSRREADRLILQGLVTVDGITARMGDKISPSQHICVNGRPVVPDTEKILLVFHKPRGIVCTAEKREKNNVVDYINYPIRIYPVGRLDKDSEGLLLMTNCGDIVNKMMRSGNFHEKEYQVSVNRPIDQAFLNRMAKGVPILDTVTRPCKIKKTGEKSFQIILTQGLNRQIRRMCEALGYRVVTLKRTRIMNIKLGDLPQGQWRKATAKEWNTLLSLIRNSSNTTVIQRGGNHGNISSKNERAGKKIK